MSDRTPIISSVKNWLKHTVIGLQLCPFAKSVFDADKISYTVSDTEDTEALMLQLHEEFKRLDDTPEIETTLVIVPQQLFDFESFNQTLDAIDDMLKQYGWAGVFQVASFHPMYQFADTQIDDRENWTNRSPYPIFQILRESSLESDHVRHRLGHPLPRAFAAALPQSLGTPFPLSYLCGSSHRIPQWLQTLSSCLAPHSGAVRWASRLRQTCSRDDRLTVVSCDARAGDPSGA